MMEYCEVIKIAILKMFHEVRKYNLVVSMNLYIHYNSHFEKTCICMCVYIYGCIYIYTYIHMCIHVYAYIYTYIYKNMYIYIHTNIYI